MKKQTDTFKRLRAVMKDINGDHRQIIKTMQSGKFVEISKIVKNLYHRRNTCVCRWEQSAN